jgi:hypothetical protein
MISFIPNLLLKSLLFSVICTFCNSSLAGIIMHRCLPFHQGELGWVESIYGHADSLLLEKVNTNHLLLFQGWWTKQISEFPFTGSIPLSNLYFASDLLSKVLK